MKTLQRRAGGKMLAMLGIAAVLLVSAPLCLAAADALLGQKARVAWNNASVSLGLQTELPAKPLPVQAEAELPWRMEPIEIRQNPARVVLWAAGLGILGVLLYTWWSNMRFSSRSRRLRHEGDASPVSGGVVRMEKAHAEAEDLARQARFAEAMHVLLLQSVSELRRRLDMTIAVSLTSREILRSVGLSREGRDAFGDIIGRVEISYFGSHLPGEEEYLACLHSFETLTAALRKGAAA